ncbi:MULTISPECIES: hypothetical protein [Lacticaseibacillus]|uniref:hypothetical protein n=1 Tax=Lacticaseibacillus TaxID=2759736 RepID=UPI00063DC98A|nr:MULTISPECIES: hypothetical protein [Lacticaseibacillus]KLI75347.1 hypothetical protein AAW28_07490 [Lacticaseibacillus casei]
MISESMNEKKAKRAIIAIASESLISAALFLIVYWQFKNQVAFYFENNIGSLFRHWWFMLFVAIGGSLGSIVYDKYHAHFMSVVLLPVMAVACAYLGYSLYISDISPFQGRRLYNTLLFTDYIISCVSVFSLLFGQFYIWFKIWQQSRLGK